MGAMEAPVLIEAIQQGNLNLLCSAQGVGKRTAERLSLELRQKLDSCVISHNQEASLAALETNLRPELEQMLTSLGYGPLEIHEALKAVNPLLSGDDAENSDAWLRESLRWLGQTAK